MYQGALTEKEGSVQLTSLQRVNVAKDKLE
jgi:hypothetical protein